MSKKGQIMEDMDRAAQEAEVAIDSIPEDARTAVANWWSEWYLSAGHKRLGRILIQFKD